MNEAFQKNQSFRKFMLAQVKDELKKCGPSIFNELM